MDFTIFDVPVGKVLASVCMHISHMNDCSSYYYFLWMSEFGLKGRSFELVTLFHEA